MIKGKQTIRVGGNVVERYREPPNPAMAARMTQYVVDYKTFQKHIPDNIKGNIVEATSGRAGRHNSMMSTNRNGRSACFGPSCSVDVGGSPDDPGKF